MNKVKIRAPQDCISLLRKYGKKSQEHFGVIALDGVHQTIGMKVLFIGSSTQCAVYKHCIAWYLAQKKATAYVVFHNHPSGYSDPSIEDVRTTKELKALGDVMGIQLLDHIIITRYDYFSFIENEEEYQIFTNKATNTKVAGGN